MLSDANVQFATNEKYLVKNLFFRLDFIEYIENKINKRNKIIGLMKIRSLGVSTKISLKIYKNYPSLVPSDAKVEFAISQKYLV